MSASCALSPTFNGTAPLSSVTGFFEFEMNKYSAYTRVNASVKGLDVAQGPFPYHVHQSGDMTGNAGMGALGHFVGPCSEKVTNA